MGVRCAPLRGLSSFPLPSGRMPFFAYRTRACADARLWHRTCRPVLVLTKYHCPLIIDAFIVLFFLRACADKAGSIKAWVDVPKLGGEVKRGCVADVFVLNRLDDASNKFKVFASHVAFSSLLVHLFRRNEFNNIQTFFTFFCFIYEIDALHRARRLRQQPTLRGWQPNQSKSFPSFSSSPLV